MDMLIEAHALLLTTDIKLDNYRTCISCSKIRTNYMMKDISLSEFTRTQYSQYSMDVAYYVQCRKMWP